MVININKFIKKHKVIISILFLILIKEIFLAAIIPLWQNNDEIEHFAYTYYLVEEGEMPVHTGGSHLIITPSQELAKANELLQSDRISFGVFANNQIIHQDFQDTLNNEEFEIKTAGLSRKNQAEKYKNPTANYAPLYYYLEAIPYKIFQNHSIITRAYAMRFFGILFLLITILFSFKIAKLFFQGNAAPYTVALLIGFLPRLSFTSTGINNDTLVIAIGTIAIYYLLSWLDKKINWQNIIVLGLIFGVGLLSKPQFYIFFLFLLVFFIYRGVKNKKIFPHLWHLGFIFIIALIISSGWLWFSYDQLNHTPTGQIQGVLSPDNETIEGIGLAQTVKFVILRYLFLTSSYFHMTGCCHEINTPPLFQGLFFIALGAGLFGFLLYLFEKKRVFKNFKTFFLLLIPLTLELAYLLIYLRQPLYTNGVDFPIDGRYLYPVISCLTIILIIGLFHITPKKIHKAVLIALFSGLIIINTYHVIFEIIPRYYL